MSQISLEIRQCLHAHRKGIALPFSHRAQKRIFSEINRLLGSYSFYVDALLDTTNKYEYLTHAFKKDRKVQYSDLITIAEMQLPIEKLIEVDFLSGIPFLEQMLELELISEKK